MGHHTPPHFLRCQCFTPPSAPPCHTAPCITAQCTSLPHCTMHHRPMHLLATLHHASPPSAPPCHTAPASHTTLHLVWAHLSAPHTIHAPHTASHHSSAHHRAPHTVAHPPCHTPPRACWPHRAAPSCRTPPLTFCLVRLCVRACLKGVRTKHYACGAAAAATPPHPCPWQ